MVSDATTIDLDDAARSGATPCACNGCKSAWRLIRERSRTALIERDSARAAGRLRRESRPSRWSADALAAREARRA